jgi:hypothetical protein
MGTGEYLRGEMSPLTAKLVGGFLKPPFAVPIVDMIIRSV